LEALVSSLDRRTAANDEMINQLLQWSSTVPNLEKNVDKIMNDLNQLGQKRVAKLESFVGTAKTLGSVAIALGTAGIAFFVYLLHFLEAHVVFKP
jgi:predicted PurR-regulated permease PerM